MQVKVGEYKALLELFTILPSGKAFMALPSETQNIIIEAEMAMVSITKRHKIDNARMAERVAEKRVNNPDYARPEREWRRK